VLEVVVGVGVAAHGGIGNGEKSMGDRLRLNVIESAGSGERGSPDLGLIVPMRAPIQEHIECPGQLPDVTVALGTRGLP
jgi:hypothetical protein